MIRSCAAAFMSEHLGDNSCWSRWCTQHKFQNSPGHAHEWIAEVGQKLCVALIVCAVTVTQRVCRSRRARFHYAFFVLQCQILSNSGRRRSEGTPWHSVSDFTEKGCAALVLASPSVRLLWEVTLVTTLSVVAPSDDIVLAFV